MSSLTGVFQGFCLFLEHLFQGIPFIVCLPRDFITNSCEVFVKNFCIPYEDWIKSQQENGQK